MTDFDQISSIPTTPAECVHVLYTQCTSLVKPFMGNPDMLPEKSICSRCQAVISKGYYAKSSYSIVGKGRLENLFCEACYSFNVGDITITGVERIAGKNSSVPIKFGMLASCGMVASVNGAFKPVFFASQKNIKKFQPPFFDRFNVQDIMSRYGQLEFIYHHCVPPFIYIADLGRKTDELIQNLKVTQSWDEVFVITPDECDALDLAASLRLYDILKDVPKKEFLLFVKMVNALSRNLSNRLEVGKTLGDYPVLMDALKALPTDPYLRLSCVGFVKYYRELQ